MNIFFFKYANKNPRTGGISFTELDCTFEKVTAKMQRGPGVCSQDYQDNVIAKH